MNRERQLVPALYLEWLDPEPVEEDLPDPEEIERIVREYAAEARPTLAEEN